MSDGERARRVAARAGELGIDADEATARRLLVYLDALLIKNRQLNLTAVRDAEQAVVLHVLDSLAVALAELPCERALDLGSGNGFPGVAVAAMRPGAEVFLMERTAKKARALQELLASAGLDNAHVLHLDAAQAPAVRPELRSSFDLVTVRAVGAPAVVARLAEPLTSRGGHLVLWLDRGTRVEPDLDRSFEVIREIVYELPEPAARERRLAIGRRR